MSKKLLLNARVNPETQQTDYYYPLEISDPSIRELARERGLEVGRAMLGFRIFDAVMVPCRNTATVNGKEVFIDTPSEVQRQRYLEYIRDELNRQASSQQDGRCCIRAANGKTKRCPLRIPNPDYLPGGTQPKTIPVKCEGCPYEPFRQAHTVVELSCFDHEGENGETEPYEISAPESYYEADRYEDLADEFVAFITARKPRLSPLAEKLVKEHSLTEASQELGRPTSTVHSQIKKLQELLNEFLDLASKI